VIRAILFDFDGTLADSFSAIAASTNHVRQHYGLPALPERTVRASVGFGLPQLMSELVPNAPSEVAMAIYRDHHDTVMSQLTELLPGVAETLAKLHESGVRLAICSNKPSRFTKQLVRDLGIADRFDTVLGPDDVGVPKPNPTMLHEAMNRLAVSSHETLYVGDMIVDVEVARAAGVPVWILRGGAGEPGAVERTNPDRVMDTFAEVLNAVRN
jgi:2-phosphoglycolate phosphatase